MNYKINLTGFFIIQFVSFIFIFLIFNIINKPNYIFTTLEVKKITEGNEFQKPIKCQIILNGKKQKLSLEKATKTITKITSLDQKTEINLEKYFLTGENKDEILIQNFNNQCKGGIKPVMVKTKDTILGNDLTKKIFQF